jgi:hypothetical protein
MTLPLVLALELPLMTVSEANARSHFHERARRAAAQRTGAYMALATPLRRAGFTNVQHVSMGPDYMVLAMPLVVRMTRLSRGELDDDNLRGALKAVRDGIADALGLKSDRDPRVEWRYGQDRASKKMPHGVRIEVWQRVLEEERQRAGTDG